MSKKRLTALLLAAAMTISAFPASQVWALEENPQSEAEKEAELTDQRYSPKEVLQAMREAIGGEPIV